LGKYEENKTTEGGRGGGEKKQLRIYRDLNGGTQKKEEREGGEKKKRKTEGEISPK